MEKAKTVSIAGSRAKTLPLNKLRLDGDTQSRLSLDEDVIKEYAGLMANGQEFPPLLVVFDGADYWLVDGFHRRWAAIKSKIEKLKCLVVEGTREDARWLSYGVNKDHGLQRTNEDKKKAVIAALKHPNGAKKSDRQIAEHVGVGNNMVSRYRSQMQSDCAISTVEERTGRDGRTINTANIGKSEKESPWVDGINLQTDLQSQVRVAEEIESDEEYLFDDTPAPATRTVQRDSEAFRNLCIWWQKADSAARTRFRLWIDGECS